MKPKKNEDQCWYFVPSKEGEENTHVSYYGDKCGTETEGMVSYMEIHSIYSHQIQTVLWMPRNAC